MIRILIMLNTLRSKSNQAMKFGKLIEYSMRKTSLEKSYTKSGGGTMSGVLYSLF